MREIKFRAWDGKKIDYDPFQCTDGPEVTGLNTNIEAMFKDWHNPKYIELMQYTGLKDKNGKEIYEGDIVKECSVSGKELFWEVAYDSEFARFGTSTEYGVLGFGEEEVMEVAGNIYENPELLK